jgi:[ribosomal protein S5]-alanine N-acetyltransferase
LTAAIAILTPRFRLRPLVPEDASERYLSWLSDEMAQLYISAAARTSGLPALRGYIQKRCGREDVLFLGIFGRDSGLHIGNIKFEPIDASAGAAVMGILIGDPAYRGRGVTPEVLEAAGRWLAGTRGVHEIALGVHADNHGAIRAYEKVGFVRGPSSLIPSPCPGTFTMLWRL